jgi:hypothetical protein
MSRLHLARALFVISYSLIGQNAEPLKSCRNAGEGAAGLSNLKSGKPEIRGQLLVACERDYPVFLPGFAGIRRERPLETRSVGFDVGVNVAD